jgi:hypothetical protein
MSPTLATVGVLSIGEMGSGIAKLLVAHNYRVVTNITGRRYLAFQWPLVDRYFQFHYLSNLSTVLKCTNSPWAVPILKDVPVMVKSKPRQVTRSLSRSLTISSLSCLHEMHW